MNTTQTNGTRSRRLILRSAESTSWPLKTRMRITCSKTISTCWEDGKPHILMWLLLEPFPPHINRKKRNDNLQRNEIPNAPPWLWDAGRREKRRVRMESFIPWIASLRSCIRPKKSSVLWEKYWDIEDKIEVHGGLTFSGNCTTLMVFGSVGIMRTLETSLSPSLWRETNAGQPRKLSTSVWEPLSNSDPSRRRRMKKWRRNR
mgnify:CR=1 FL=1